MSEQATKFEEWALVELFGHQRIAGKVTEQTIAGGAFLRVDVPDADGKTKFTRFYGAAAVYAINPVSAEIAMQMAQRMDAAPVHRYELPQLAQASDRDDE